jgi:glycogen debranching enzyme
MNIGFLTVDPASLSAEEFAAWTFLCSCQGLRARQIAFSELERDPDPLRRFDVLWWHSDSATEVPPSLLNQAIIRRLITFADRGGGILLSLLAAPYVVGLGLESVPPNVRISGAWSEPSWTNDYPDMRGLAPYLGHPVFKGLWGGTFTWSPLLGNRYAAAYYENTLPAQGEVVAVEKCYIKLNEHRRIASEYSCGRGKVLTIGAHLCFSSASSRFAIQRELFARNCLTYLGVRINTRLSSKNREFETPRTFWRFESPTVEERPSTKSTASLRHLLLPRRRSDLEIHRDLRGTARDEFFSVNGDRALLMGTERGGFEEMWAHPVRIARQFRAGIQLEGGRFVWLSELSPEVSVRPEFFSRRYTLEEAVIEETIFTDLQEPTGVISYKIASPRHVEIIITAAVDLRQMWPLSPQSTGGLRFRWDRGLNACIVSDKSGQLCSVVGSNRSPVDKCVGQFRSVALVEGTFVGERTEQAQVSLAMRFSFAAGSAKLAIIVSGSSLGERDAVAAHRRTASDPRRSLERRIARFAALERQTTQVETPDIRINSSLRWATWSLDRLFAFTPGLGMSLVAGYGLSSSGWSGGQEPSGRPGYAWYFARDGVWASLAILASGNFKKVRGVLEFLGAFQDPSGKIVHELTMSGFAHYDAADSTPLYLFLMGRYVRASGDREFARSQFGRVLAAVRFCFSTDTDKDHLIENSEVGHGWIEGGHLFPSHSEYYLEACWASALEESAYIAHIAGRAKLRSQWQREAARVGSIIEKRFWNPETESYRFALLQDGTFSNEETILSTVGMYLGWAHPARTARGLGEFASDRFTTDWGVRLVGKDHPSYKPSGYHSGSIWPLFTGWTSLAEFRCHRPLQGYSHLLSNLNLVDHFSAGCVEEVLDGQIFAPAGVCPHQAWSESMVLQPFLEGMLGLKPDALTGTLYVHPYVPPGWSGLSVRNIAIGDTRIDLVIHRSADQSTYTFTRRRQHSSSARRRPITIVLEPLFPLGSSLLGAIVNGMPVSTPATIRDHVHVPKYKLRLDRSATVRIRHRLGIAMVPEHPLLAKGERSQGLRIIDERWKRGSYEILVEGRQDQEYLADMYDPCESISRIEGGIALAREGSRLLVSIRFHPEQSSEGYVKKQLKFAT